MSAPDFSAFEHDILPINGLHMHVARLGAEPAKAPIVLCLHGFPDLWCGWARVMTALGDRFHCVAPDQRGYNLTSRPPDVDAYRPRHLLADIGALMDALSPDQPVILAGHDWGGLLAAWFAASRPERVAKLVLVNATHPALFQDALWRDAEQRQASLYIEKLRSGELEKQWAAIGFDVVAQSRIGAALAAGAMDEAEAALYRAAWATPEAWRAMIHWYRAAPFSLNPDRDTGNAALAIPALRAIPTLVIWGDKDPVFLPRLRDGLSDYIPNLEFVRLPEVGHNPLRDAPNTVAAAMRAFLSAT